MQRAHEGQRQNAKKEVIAIQNSHLGARKLYRNLARIIFMDEETPEIYAKVIPKRKKGFDRGITIITGFIPGD